MSTSTDSSISTFGIRKIIEILRNQKFRDTTKENYYTIWKVSNNFFIKLDCKPSSWEERQTLFVGYLVQNNRKSTTIKCYISAIKAVLEQLNIKLHLDRCLFTSLTRACRLHNGQISICLPIQKGVLAVILDKITTLYDTQPYLCDLYRALLCTAYYGLFRVGELTNGNHPVLARDVHIGLNKKKLLFILRMSKSHGKDSKPQLIKIASAAKQTKQGSNLSKQSELELPYPYVLLQKYLLRRGSYRSNTEQFFIFAHKQPVQTKYFRSCLKSSLKLGGFDERNYNTHSLQIGCSCDLYKLGVSVENIKKLGRWKSNVVFKYLHSC